MTRLLPILLALCLVLGASDVFAATPDYGAYAELLAAHVRDGRVDYAGLKREETRLDAILDAFAAWDPESLEPNGQKAFYINLYNAWTLKLVLTRYPGIRSIKDAGSLLRSPWKIPLVRLGSKTLTLDAVEHDILRPRFKDPRIHCAVNCAAKSCPPLRVEPYQDPRLDAQLDDAAASFVNDPSANRVRQGVVEASKIFDWYAEDFGGRAGVLAFFRKYAGPDLAAALRDLGPEPAIRFLDYDWSLNGE